MTYIDPFSTEITSENDQDCPMVKIDIFLNIETQIKRLLLSCESRRELVHVLELCEDFLNFWAYKAQEEIDECIELFVPYQAEKQALEDLRLVFPDIKKVVLSSYTGPEKSTRKIYDLSHVTKIVDLFCQKWQDAKRIIARLRS